MFRELTLWGKQVVLSVASLADDYREGIHGRARVCVEDKDEVRVEYHVPGTSWGVQLQLSKGGESPVRWMLGLGLFSLYGAIESRVVDRATSYIVDHWLPGDMGMKWSGRRFGLRFFDGAVWWDLGSDDFGWTSERPKWKDGSWRPLGFNMRCTEPSILETGEVLIPMPERSYRGKAVVTEASWGYSKLPRYFHKARRSVSIEMLPGEQVPVPGKGENSWDCDDDALFSMTSDAQSIEDAIGKFVSSALRTRRRYGGPNWTPDLDTHKQA